MLTPNQAIILHELVKQVREGLKVTPKGTFELSRPLSLEFELTHYRELEKIEKELSHVLENISNLDFKSPEPANLPEQQRILPTSKADSPGA